MLLKKLIGTEMNDENEMKNKEKKNNYETQLHNKLTQTHRKYRIQKKSLLSNPKRVS